MRKLFSIFAAMLVALVANAAVIRINTETEDALRLALNDAKSGDIIEMAAGRYVESNANFIAFTGKEVTVRAALGAEVILQPKVPIIIAEGGKAELIGIQIDASHLNDVEDWYEHVIYASDADANNRLVMKDCVLKNFLPNKSAIYCSASNKLASIEIDGCYIHDIMKSVIFIESTDSTNLTVTNSTIANVVTNTESYYAGVIDSRATKGDVLVDHCTFYNAIPMNTDYGAIGKIKTAGNKLVSNSIFMLPEAKDGIRCIRDAKEAKNCLVFNYIKDSNWGIHSSVTKTDCINDKDPLFKDAANSDFTLLEGSPALTAGPDSSCIGDPFWGPKAAPEYYIVGTMNDWYYDEDYKLAANPAAEGEFMLKTTLAIGDEFKVVDSDENWYPAGLDNNFVVDKSFAGEKTIYFRPKKDGGEGWHEGTIFVEKTIFSSCADVYAKAKNDVVNLEDVVVTYVNGKNVYVKDETGAMLLYLPANATWKAGDVLSGVVGKVDIYNGLYEVKPSADQVAAVTAVAGEAPAPEKLTSIDTLDISKYVLLENVTVQADTFKTSKATNLNMVLGNDTIVLRNNFKLAYVFEAGKEYNIIGTVSIYNGTLQVFFISAEEVVHTYTVAGSSKAIFGTTWDANNADNEMVRQEDGTYVFEKTEVALAEGKIEFKIVEDHTKWIPDQNVEINILVSGIYTVTIIFNPETKSIATMETMTAEADIIPTVAMHGNFTGEWKDTELFFLDDDSLSATLLLDLKAGNYEFGMKIDGNWTANGANLTRENPSTCLVEGSGNMHIAVDVEGAHIFTYTFATQTLEVLYPELPAPSLIDTVKFFTGDNWAIDTESTVKWDGINEKVIIDIKLAKQAQWQGQLWLKLPMEVRSGYEYDLSFKIKADKSFEGTTVKYQENAEMHYNDKGLALVANEEKLYEVKDMRGLANGNGVLVIDFGFAPAETHIEVYEIAIEEHEASGPLAKFYVTGNDAFTADAGLEAAQAWHPDALPSYGDTLTVALKAGAAYQLKVCVDGSWNTAKNFNDLTEKAPGLIDADGDNHNIGFSLVADGDVKIIYTAEVFKLEGNFATEAIDNTLAGEKAVKTIVNGQLLIIKNGKTFNVLGTVVR